MRDLRTKLGWAAGSLALLMVACDDGRLDSLYSEADARALTTEFCRALMDGKVDRAAECCGAPFRYSTREWETPEQIRGNLTTQLTHLQERLSRPDTLEVFSHGDLLEGRWPRGRKVAEEDRSAQAEKLGVRADGFYVRAYRGRQQGIRLYLSPSDDRTRLLVTGIDP